MLDEIQMINFKVLLQETAQSIEARKRGERKPLKTDRKNVYSREYYRKNREERLRKWKEYRERVWT